MGGILQVWAMFSDEVQEAKKDMVASRSQYPADLPSFAGRAVVLKMRKNRLVYLKKVSSYILCGFCLEA